MKKILLSALMMATTAVLFAQDLDTTKLRIGSAKILIIDNDKDTTGLNWTSVDSLKAKASENKGKLTYWQGIDLGVNMLRTPAGSFTMNGSNYWLDLEPSRSLSVRLNFIEEKIRLAKDYAGILVGAGLTYNSYGLAKNITLISTNTSAKDTLYGDTLRNVGYTYSKNKLRMSYISIPLMLEFNTSENPDRNFHIAAGAIVGWNMGTIWKTKYNLDGKDRKDRSKGDFNVNPFQADLSVRLGYKQFIVFGSYGLLPVFVKGKGPEVYNACLGISIDFD